MIAASYRQVGSMPYCGAAPSPLTLLSRWNLDPILLALLAALLLAYAVLVGRTPGGIARWQRWCGYAGWAVCALALVSPLCALSVSLFSARLGQHMILATLGAPLVALGFPLRANPAGPLHTARRHHQAMIAAAVFALTLWFWHAPGPYAATFDGATIYWLMHVTTLGAALWLWRAVLAASGPHLGASLAAMLATTLQMGFLGALLTFSVRPFYAVHRYTTGAWGLSPLEDQQLGGIIMWIPTGIILVTAIVVAVAVMLRRAEAGPAGMVRS